MSCLGIPQAQRFRAFVKVGTYRKSMKPEITEIDHHRLLFPLIRWVSSFELKHGSSNVAHQSPLAAVGVLRARPPVWQVKGGDLGPPSAKIVKINFDSLIKSKCPKCTSPQEPFESSVIWRAHAIWRCMESIFYIVYWVHKDETELARLSVNHVYPGWIKRKGLNYIILQGPTGIIASATFLDTRAIPYVWNPGNGCPNERSPEWSS